MMVMQLKRKKNEKKDNRYLLMKKKYTNVKSEAHQLRMPCKKSNAYLFVCLFLK
jgi:hypothetical protein